GCGDGRGKILQRFPAKEWEDAPFPQGLELFCQPSGWKTSTERVPPSFFVVVLTDINSERHYCACLTFQEPFLEPNDSDGEEEEQEEVDDTGLVKPAQVFAPKSLVLVSRRDCTEIFRNCLGLLYTAHTDSLRVPLETLVGNLLSCVVPTAGGAQKLFSLGAGDRQVIQAPLNDTLPITGSSVAILFRQLGIRHVLNLFCAAVTEHKVLFHSSSYQRLSDACRAMLALMFPLKYSYPYIPILPAQLLEVLSTPTPFIIGVHSMFINHLPDLVRHTALVLELSLATNGLSVQPRVANEMHLEIATMYDINVTVLCFSLYNVYFYEKNVVLWYVWQRSASTKQTVRTLLSSAPMVCSTVHGEYWWNSLPQVVPTKPHELYSNVNKIALSRDVVPVAESILILSLKVEFCGRKVPPNSSPPPPTTPTTIQISPQTTIVSGWKGRRGLKKNGRCQNESVKRWHLIRKGWSLRRKGVGHREIMGIKVNNQLHGEGSKPLVPQILNIFGAIKKTIKPTGTFNHNVLIVSRAFVPHLPWWHSSGGGVLGSRRDLAADREMVMRWCLAETRCCTLQFLSGMKGSPNMREFSPVDLMSSRTQNKIPNMELVNNPRQEHHPCPVLSFAVTWCNDVTYLHLVEINDVMCTSGGGGDILIWDPLGASHFSVNVIFQYDCYSSYSNIQSITQLIVYMLTNFPVISCLVRSLTAPHIRTHSLIPLLATSITRPLDLSTHELRPALVHAPTLARPTLTCAAVVAVQLSPCCRSSISKNIVRNAKAGMRTIGLQIPTKKKLGMQPGHCLPVMQEDDTLSSETHGSLLPPSSLTSSPPSSLLPLLPSSLSSPPPSPPLLPLSTVTRGSRPHPHTDAYPTRCKITFYQPVGEEISLLVEARKLRDFALSTLLVGIVAGDAAVVVADHVVRRDCAPVLRARLRAAAVSEDGEPPEGSPTLRPERATLERRSERSCCLDYQRLGLGTLSNSLNRAGTEPFRITAANRLYHLCHRWPAGSPLLPPLPQCRYDMAVTDLRANHTQTEFCVVCELDRRLSGMAVTAAGPMFVAAIAGFIGQMMTPESGPASSESSASLEQEKYLLAIMATMPGAAAEIWGRGVTVRGSQANHDAGRTRTAAKWGSLRVSRRFTSTSSTTSGSNQTLNQTPADSAATTTTLPLSIHKAALYVVGDKAQLKGWRKEGLVAMETIPVDMADLSAMRSSFRKLLHACCPSSAPTDGGSSAFLTALEQSEWLPQVPSIVFRDAIMVHSIENASGSCQICEANLDCPPPPPCSASQVVSLVQLLSDPFYRTLDGFRLLIEKEWLAFGHRFGQRSNMGAGGQSANFTPVFLQFLDCVHQVQYQFPTEFEFNDYYLRFLAYHHVSNRFRTFLLDSDYERIEQGVLYEEKGARSCGQSLWEYVDSLHRRAPLFYSFLYSPGEDSEVLRLCCSTAALHLWGYYTGEALREGPPYDPELLPEAGHGADEWAPDGAAGGGGPGCGTAVAQSGRRTLWWGYHAVARTQPDGITAMLQVRSSGWETALGRTGERWKETWDRARAKVPHTSPVRLHGTERGSFSHCLLCCSNGGRQWGVFVFHFYVVTSVSLSKECACVCIYIPSLWWPPTRSMQLMFVFVSCVRRSYEGVLYKRGALLKGWKARWFVLDKTKHQV
uniref:Myotubularin phosphatase domain-containing protein n=1 Tax=Petromyzon marinus TaxID=7757 RepID=S4RYP5_PETMA